MEQEFIKIKEVAKMFGVSVPTIRNWERKGYIVPAITLPSGRKRYTRKQIEDFITNQEE